MTSCDEAGGPANVAAAAVPGGRRLEDRRGDRRLVRTFDKMAVIEAVLGDVHEDWETHERRRPWRLLSDGSERADDSESTCAQQAAHILH